VVSVVAHVVLVLLLITYSGPRLIRTVRLVALGEPPGAREFVLPAVGSADRRVGGSAERVETVVTPVPTQVPETVAPVDSTDVAVLPLPPGEEGQGEVALAEDRGVVGEIDRQLGRTGALGPRYGDGRLWIRPRDAIAAAIAGALDEAPVSAETHAARIDSAITRRLYAFLDTLRPDSMAVAPAPDWTTEIDGQTWGVDGSWIYLGPIKLPSIILALLPLPHGNYDQNRAAAALQRVREDILQAAWRAETADQFRRYVEETRRRREAERAFERNRRVPPDSGRE
jgi:hypothetical protein